MSQHRIVITGLGLTALVAHRSTSWLAIGHTDPEVVASALVHNPSAEPVEVVVARLDGTAVDTFALLPGGSMVRVFPTAMSALRIDATASVVVSVQAERLGGLGVALTSAIPLR